MSKKEEKNKTEQVTPSPLVPKKRKKRKWPFILLFLLIIAGAVFFFRKPILMEIRKIPVVGKFVPVTSDMEENKPSIEELEVITKSQERELEQLNAKIAELESSNAALSEKKKSLLQYETMYNDFMNQKAAWDEEVARTDPERFMSQFESIYPDVANQIYKTLKGEKILSDKQRELSNTIGQMDEEQAAKALELLITTDPELIQSIFDGMAADRKALILSEMNSAAAAQVIKLISPDEP